MVAPVVTKSVILKGLIARFTREDACGVPLCGATASVVTNGFIEVNLSPVIDEGTDFTQKLADGSFCTNQKDGDIIKWWTAEVWLCAMDPSILELAAGETPVLDYQGHQTGFRETGVASDTFFGLELWNQIDSSACEGDGLLRYDYQLVPGLTNMVLEDLNFGNKRVDLKMRGNTFFNPNWGKGPYDVVPQAGMGNPAGPLLTCMGSNVHFHNESTTVAPPTAADGYTAVVCLEGGTDGDPAVVLPCV